MGDTTRWLLPNGIDELLPEQAGRVEDCRRLCSIPVPVGVMNMSCPRSLSLRIPCMLAWVLTSNYSVANLLITRPGKPCCQADITPQVARIDAHSMGLQGVNRLCYAGSTLKSVANSIPADRSPVPLRGNLWLWWIEADIEVVDLLLSLVERSGLSDITFDIGTSHFASW